MTNVVRITRRGVRGENFADLLRRTGESGVVPTDTDEEALDKFRDGLGGGIDLTDENVKIGTDALDVYASTGAVAVGEGALVQATGIRNVALGAAAGGGITTGIGNVFLGYGAGAAPNQLASADYSIVIGYNAYSTADAQVVIGDAGQDHLKMLGISMARWDGVGSNLSLGGAGRHRFDGYTGPYNVAIGPSAHASGTTGSGNVAVGFQAMELNATGNGNVAVGAQAMQMGTGVFDTVTIGQLAGRYAATGVGMTAVGYRSQEKATVALNNTSLGDSAFWMFTTGQRGVAIGYRSAEYVVDGDDPIYIGTAAGVNRANGDRVIAIGTHSCAFPALTPDAVTGAGTQTAGHRIVAVGHETLKQTTGSDFVAVGDQAGASLTSGSDCVFIGSGAGNHASQKVDAVGATVIGKGAYSTRSNEIVIGKATDTHATIAGVEFTKAQLQALLALVS